MGSHHYQVNTSSNTLKTYEIRQPLLLVSEIQRSGGSMMAQLLDGHPQLHAHPFEIQTGYPRKWHWPELSPKETPRQWFDRLFEPRLKDYIRNGFAKAGDNRYAGSDRHPFDFSIDEQRAIFVAQVERRQPACNREILDCYFTSFFAAWRNCQPNGLERYVSGFTPRVNMVPASHGGFFRDYPDGRMITLVRDPLSWYASARRHHPRYWLLGPALRQWRRSLFASLWLSQTRPDHVLLLSFAEVLRAPEATMRRVAAFAGIDWHVCLLTPTYLGRAVRPNSSFQVDQTGINASMLKRSTELTPHQRRCIERDAMPLYRRAFEDLKQPALAF